MPPQLFQAGGAKVGCGELITCDGLFEESDVAEFKGLGLTIGKLKMLQMGYQIGNRFQIKQNSARITLISLKD